MKEIGCNKNPIDKLETPLAVELHGKKKKKKEIESKHCKLKKKLK